MPQVSVHIEPRVSVVITSYNLGWCIEDTLKSVFDQTYQNIEVIVVDDASTDDTAERIAPFARRIKYIRHETNQGVLSNAEAGPARNSGIRAASGDYVAILDGDDLWAPAKIALQVAAARQFPEAGLIVTDGVSFAHEDGRILRSTLLLDTNDPFFSTLPEDAIVATSLYERMLRECVIDTPSQVMIASRVFDTVGLFSECRCDDYDFYVRATAEFDVAIVKKPLVRYRQHRRNLSGAAANQFFRFVQPNLDIWKRHLQVCRPEVRPLVKAQMERALATGAKQAVNEGRRGNRAWARRWLWDLAVRNPGPGTFALVGYQMLRLHCPPGLSRPCARFGVRQASYRLLRAPPIRSSVFESEIGDTPQVFKPIRVAFF